MPTDEPIDAPTRQRVQRLLDRDEIRQLAERYGLAVDAKDLDTLAQLFDHDVDFGRWGKGPEGVKAFYDNALRLFISSMHMVGNHVIDFDDDDHAHGVVYCRAHHHFVDPDHWGDLAFAYFDRYVRRDGGWRFQRRDVRSWYRQTFGHPHQGTDRTVVSGESKGVLKGSLPEGFPTWAEFWDREPAPRPT